MKLEKKKFNPKIFWIGPFIPSNYIKHWLAASPAAMKWQKHLFESLVEEDVDIEWLYYRPDSYWPKGRFLPSREKISSKIVHNQNQIHYLNTFILRDITLKKSLEKILKEKANLNSSQPLIIISYNEPEWVKKTLSDQNIRSKFSCIYIVADEEVPSGGDGYVFLSYYSFKKYNQNLNKLHLDGAIYPLNSIQNAQKPYIKKNKTIFFYSGSFFENTGVKILLDVMELLNENNFELWISGSGNNSFLRSAIKNDKRIKFFGLLTSKQLQNAYKKADIFLNPRPVDMFVNDISFPSKLFDYLSWNKPIISTCTKSLDPIYKKILHIVEDDPVSIALAMRSYLEGKKYYKTKNKKWILNKNWNNEANKLKAFLKKVVIKKNFT
tara:strand:+ start:2594 stop:3736 length:1143 start_codon:yes stop_codon:yes gene_type:complete